MIRIDEDMVLLLHQLIVQGTGGAPDLRDKSLLDSALQGAFQTSGGKDLYHTKEEKAARLGHSLISHHAFVDGNKRIGMLAMLTFLEANGIPLRCAPGDIAVAGLAVASGEMSCKDLLDWILARRRRLPRPVRTSTSIPTASAGATTSATTACLFVPCGTPTNAVSTIS